VPCDRGAITPLIRAVGLAALRSGARPIGRELVGCAAISFGASCGTYGGHCVGCWSRRPSCGPVAASRGHGGDRRSGKWRRTENNAIWVDQHELEERSEATEARDENFKGNIRLETSTESTAETEAAESAKIVEAAELAKVSKKTMQDAVQPLAV
jgi:hypothetical protein